MSQLAEASKDLGLVGSNVTWSTWDEQGEKGVDTDYCVVSYIDGNGNEVEYREYYADGRKEYIKGSE
jgi:hypothetical protein